MHSQIFGQAQQILSFEHAAGEGVGAGEVWTGPWLLRAKTFHQFSSSFFSNCSSIFHSTFCCFAQEIAGLYLLFHSEVASFSFSATSLYLHRTNCALNPHFMTMVMHFLRFHFFVSFISFNWKGNWNMLTT